MKKILVFLGFLMLLSCSDKNEPQQENSVSHENFMEQEYSYSRDNLNENCTINSEVACAVESAVKCILKPDLPICADLGLPSFVFMDDESLQRPTEQSFEITKLKPIPGGKLEVYTKGKCNGNILGLCSGNIIYVLEQKDGRWKFFDIYAVE